MECSFPPLILYLIEPTQLLLQSKYWMILTIYEHFMLTFRLLKVWFNFLKSYRVQADKAHAQQEQDQYLGPRAKWKTYVFLFQFSWEDGTLKGLFTGTVNLLPPMWFMEYPLGCLQVPALIMSMAPHYHKHTSLPTPQLLLGILTFVYSSIIPQLLVL